MSYKITVYFNDENIESTDIYGYQGLSHVGYYGNDYYSKDGLTSPVEFTASPADGCSFTRWVYRLGSTTSTQQYSNENPFQYNGSEDIYIRAEGEPTTTEPEAPTWSLSTESVGTITELYSRYFNIDTYTLYCHTVKFKNAGTATFYTESDMDTRGYLSATSSWDKEYGEPNDYLDGNNNSGDGNNFRFSYDVEANTTYYVWVRSNDGEGTGYVNLYIIPPEPEVIRPSNFSWTYAKTKGSAFNLTADEWNELTECINAFRVYRGLDNYNFTVAYSGNDFTAAIYNEAVEAIQDIEGYTTYVYKVNKGDDITAFHLNGLRNELNAIP